MFNSAKNRYDDDDVENSTLSTLNTSINHSDSSNSINNSNNVVNFNNNKKFNMNHFNDEELFQNDLQRGFRDIINIYNNNVNICEPSNACNYYCNLNLIKNNKNNCFYNNNYNNNFVNYQKVFVFNNNNSNNFYFSKSNNNSFYNNCNNNCNFGLNPPYFSYYNSNNFVLKSENLKKNLNQRKNSN